MTYTQYAEPYPASRGDRFGSKIGRLSMHRGQDTAPGGLPILALATGTIVRKVWSEVLGWCTVLKHADGKYTGYAHAAAPSRFPIGTVIRRGASIGCLIGSTGSSARGRHLHYTLGADEGGLFFGRVEDPLVWIRAHSAPETVPAPAGLYTAAAHDGIRGPVYWQMIDAVGRMRAWKIPRGKIEARLAGEALNAIKLRWIPHTTTARDGIPGRVYTWRSQAAGRALGYYRGPVDKREGPNTDRARVRITAALLNRLI